MHRDGRRALRENHGPGTCTQGRTRRGAGKHLRNKTDFSAQFAPSAMPTRDTHEQDMKTVLFCGGLGTRIRDVSESLPTAIDRHDQLMAFNTKASGVQWTR